MTAAVLRALRRLPLLRAYPALLDARADNRDLRDRLKRVQLDLELARQLIAQRELALRSGQDSGARIGAPAFDASILRDRARVWAETYRSAAPFPHWVQDDVFDSAFLDAVLAEFDAMDRGGWRQSEGNHERKWSTEDWHRLGPFTSTFISQLSSGPFIEFLEDLTGISGLVPDPHLRGGGLHEIRVGGLLGIHADFNVHPRLGLYRRLNLLVYLNRAWVPSWGGALELWDQAGKELVRSIGPSFNRAVVFDTSNFSYHGHPHPLACPPGRTRKSIALYYYTAERPSEADSAPHGTLFLDAAGELAAGHSRS